MSYASFEAVYAGVASQINANQSLTISIAGDAITFVPIYLDKREAYLKLIQKDVQDYLLATLDIGKGAQSKAAYYNEKKSKDSSEMDAKTNDISVLIENFKNDAQMDEVGLQTAIGMQEPINSYLKSLVNLLATGF